ncbi:MAG TPA: OmpA family protein [Puia sp.]|nr:OmpA family protein [Puia sp.]
MDGGIQGTHYRLPAGSTWILPGGTVGLLYAFPLETRLDLLAGISAGVYRTEARLPDGTTFANYQVDDQGSAFEYRMKTAGYKEAQHFVAAEVPVLLQYHTTVSGKEWYVNAGGKMVFPASDHIDISAQQLSLSGYYPDYNVELSDLPKHGFGKLNGWKTSTLVNLKPTVALSASTGVGFALSHNMVLYAGVFLDYGLTDMQKRHDSMPLFTYNPAGVSGTRANGVLNMPNTGPVNLLSFGLQVRLSLGSVVKGPVAHSARRKTVQEQQLPAQTQQPPAQPQQRPPQRSAEPAQTPPAPLKAQSNPLYRPTPPVEAPPTSVPANASTPPSTAAEGLTDAERKVMQTPVLFGTLGEVSLSDMSQSQLDDVVLIMKSHPGLRISITGHICNSGTATESARIGETRAKTVAAYLRRKGIDRKRMDIGFVRESDPVVPNNPAKNYLKRRVVLSVE